MLKNCLKKMLEEYLEIFDYVSAEMLVMDDVLKILSELEEEYQKNKFMNHILCSFVEQLIK